MNLLSPAKLTDDEVDFRRNLTTLKVHALISDLGNLYTHRDKFRDRQGSYGPVGIDSSFDGQTQRNSVLHSTEPISRD